MSVDVKICGVRDQAAVMAAIEGHARYIGFVFYPKSPRVVTPEEAANLITLIPHSISSVGLFVDPTDEEIAYAHKIAPFQMIQLHGTETLERVQAIKSFIDLPVIKAIGVSSDIDIRDAQLYEVVADLLLLDAKPMVGGMPGGNARGFDWTLTRNLSLSKPWILAGGLDAYNINEAVSLTGASILDVSSGVEDAPGIKNTRKIKVFLENAARIETCC